MDTMLPSVREAHQLQRLRSLRVERARERCAQAARDLETARQAVLERQRLIDTSRSAIAALAESVVSSLAPSLPRWNGMVGAERARLVDRLERDIDAMFGDRKRQNAAASAAAQAQTELTRAIGREDVVRDLVRQARSALASTVERRAEIETEDQGRACRPQGAAA